jgi:hypothetical protein
LFTNIRNITAAWAAMKPGEPGLLFDSPKPELERGGAGRREGIITKAQE